MKYLTIAKTALLTILFSALAVAASAQQRPGHPSGEQMKRWAEARGERHPMVPNLTDDQKSQIKEIMLDTRKKVQPLENQLGEKRAHLKTLTTADQVDMDEINSIIDEIGDLHTQIMKLRVAAHQQIRNLLTDEQKVMFDAHPMRRMHQRMDRHPF